MKNCERPTSGFRTNKRIQIVSELEWLVRIGGWPQRRIDSLGGKPVLLLGAQDIGDGDPIQMRTDLPGRQDFVVDELVDRLATELPSLTQLRHGEPCASRGHPL